MFGAPAVDITQFVLCIIVLDVFTTRTGERMGGIHFDGARVQGTINWF